MTMLSYKEYAKHINRHPYEVLNFIQDKRITGSRKSQYGYRVPEDALINCLPPKKKNPTEKDYAFYILKALNKSQNVNARLLGIPKKRFDCIVASLEDKGLIRREESERPYNSGLALTWDGMEVASRSKVNFDKWARTGLAAAVEGAVRALTQ